VDEHTYGEGDLQYWLYEPAGPKPESAPVVIFNHGWSAMTPGGYRGWIDHIVRRGNIVIYPRYQASLRTKPDKFNNNAIAATKDALQRLQTEDGHVRPQLDKVAVVGHSAGGQISAGMAARAASVGLPPLKAVMCVEPGKSWGPKMMQIPQDSVAPMPASTLLLTVIGDKDTIVKDIDGKRIINETVLVPPENKNLVQVISDDHGSPALKATHFFPAAPGAESSGGMGAKMSGGSEKSGPLRQMIRDRIRKRMEQSASQRNTVSGDVPGSFPSSAASAGSPSELPDPGQNTIEESAAAQQAGQPLLDNRNMKGINALDYYCTWKLFDALEDAAFFGKNRDYALGNTPKQRYMGKWSDGVPVKELVVYTSVGLH
jgi:dienelactone hydrolase